ncbi:MAG: copper-binding protein [Caulobacter sp.]|nr:copper-binding protein [Caulobacter sp.]
MNKLGAAAVILALAVSACGPQSGSKDGDRSSALARAKIIPPGPTGPMFASNGTVVEAEGAWVTLDHEGAPESGLAAGRTKFRTWAEVIAQSPGAAGDRVAFKFQKLGEEWALVEMTAR